MPTLQELRERRADVWSHMTEINDRAQSAGELSAEDRAAYDAAEADFDRLTDEIQRVERHEARAREIDRVETDPHVVPSDPERADDSEDAYRQAFIEYVRGGLSSLDPDQRQILRSGWRDHENRAQAVGTNSAGGYLVPQGFRAQLIETMKDFGAVRNVAQVITTETGNNLPWPTNDDTGNVGALLAENTQASEQDLTIGQATLGAYKYSSKIVRVSLEFLQDVSWMDAEEFLARKLGERVARIENQHQTTGSGTAQPQGIVTGATSGVTAASATVITSDELIDLIHSVDPAYRRSPRAQFMTSDAGFKVARKLKDANGNYLFEPSAAAGAPDRLFGYPVVINQDMAEPATGVKSWLFGDFTAGYVVREVRGFQLIRMDERYADFFQVGFVGFSRMDARTQNASAYKALTQA